MAKSPTAYLALQLPVPGSKEPFRVADVNEWFTILDTKAQTTDATIADRTARIVTLEKNLTGTTAERDAIYGIPATPAARVALASKSPRWFNTDKGYEQQYYAQFDDPSVGNAPAKATHGWAPAMSNGRVLLDRFTIGKDGGVGTVTKKGARADAAAVTTLTVDGVFSADFDEYEIDLTIASASVDIGVQFRLRAAGVTAVSNNYAWAYREVAPGIGTDVTGAGSAQGIVARAGTLGAHMHLRIQNPMLSTRWKYWTFQSFDSAAYSRVGGGYFSGTGTPYDGFLLGSGTAATWTGEVFVYGIVKP